MQDTRRGYPRSPRNTTILKHSTSRRFQPTLRRRREESDEEQIGLPGFLYRAYVITNKHDMAGPERFAPQRHPRLVGGSAALLIIARGASRNEVLPRVLPTARLRHDVVDRQALAATAILATEVIAPEDVFTGEHDAPVWHPHIELEPNDTGPGKREARRAHEVPRKGLYKFGFMEMNKDDRPLHATYRKRAVILIENQNMCPHCITLPVLVKTEWRGAGLRRRHKQRRMWIGDLGKSALFFCFAITDFVAKIHGCA